MLNVFNSMINNSKLPFARDKQHISITFDSFIAFCEHSERHLTLCVHTTESLVSSDTRSFE